MSAPPPSLRLCMMTTNSMRPTIDVGDFIMIADAVPGGFEPGDLVLLPGAGGPAVHRVVEIRTVQGERWLVTKGDACVVADAPVREAAVAGRAALLGRGGSPWIRLDHPAVRWTARAAAAAFVWTSAAAATGAGRGLERLISAVLSLAWAEIVLRALYDAALRRRWLWARGLRRALMSASVDGERALQHGTIHAQEWVNRLGWRAIACGLRVARLRAVSGAAGSPS